MKPEARPGVDPDELRRAMELAELGYCNMGIKLMKEFKPASPEFAKHAKKCPHCLTALGKEKSASNAN